MQNSIQSTSRLASNPNRVCEEKLKLQPNRVLPKTRKSVMVKFDHVCIQEEAKNCERSGDQIILQASIERKWERENVL